MQELQPGNSQVETATNLLNYVAKYSPQTIKELNEKALLRQKIRENITQQDIENYLEQKKGKQLKAEQEEKGFFTGVAESINLKSVPYLGNLIEGRESEKAVNVILKAKNQPELLTKEEITDFDKYINELNNQNLAGEGGLLYRLGKGALPTIKYSLEYALNTAVVGNSIGGSLITSLEPTRLYKNYQAKQLQGLIDITDKGKMFFSELEKKPFLTTLYKAYATSLSSDITETIGGAITNNPFTRSVIGKTTGVKKKILEALFGVSKRTGVNFGDLVNGLYTRTS